MTWRTLLRTSYGIRLISIIVVMTFMGYSYGEVMPGSWEFGIAAEKINVLMMTSAVAALGTVLEGRRYWASGSLTHHGTRSRGRVLIWPVLLAVLPAVVATAPAVLAFNSPGIKWVVLIALGWILGWSGIGLLIGMTCPLQIGVPTVLAVPTLALLYGAAVSPPWISYLVGYYAECCSPSQRIDPRALEAGATVAAGMLLVSAILCAARLRSLRIGPAGLVGLLIVGLVGTCTGAALRVHTMDAFPVVSRTGSRVCSGTPRTCVWPEHRPWLPELSGDVTQITARWRAGGVDVPDEVVEGMEASTPTVLRWEAPVPAADPARRREANAYNLAAAMAYAPCQTAQSDSDTGVPVQVMTDQDRVIAWLVIRSGYYSGDPTRTGLDAGALAWTSKLSARPVAEQARQITTMLTALRTCR